MTLEGTVNKTGILLLCAVATAAWTWHLAMNPATLPLDYLLLLVGLIRRIDFRAGHDVQEDVGSGDGADLRAAGGSGAGRAVGDAGAAVSGDRD
jgi:hypothetical protein